MVLYIKVNIAFIYKGVLQSMGLQTGLSNWTALNWYRIWGFPGGSDSQESACNTGNLGSIPGLGRSPGEGNGNPLQYSCLEKCHAQRSLASYMGLQTVGHDWVTDTHTHAYTHWEMNSCDTFYCDILHKAKMQWSGTKPAISLRHASQ